ncbi:S8 family serine peptidase [uncultured Arsenicicoccus sp.]|uniref:S8 family serine peptidase n=1 Tax=uncultured Arsenicicoccus sp. TaxID=491339 RepID=UPI002591D699|nr:S8 family serine peptidase [uncultured Arsenicicoccus sp.]
MQTRARVGVALTALAALLAGVGAPSTAHAQTAPAPAASAVSAQTALPAPVSAWSAPASDGSRPGWSTRNASVLRAPAAVVAPALASGASRLRVVTTRVVGGQPVVSTATVPAAQAVATVDRAQDAPGAVAVSVDTRAQATGYNDPIRPQQWSLSRLGGETFHGRVSTAGVTVAVVDTGVDGGHPDLRGVLVPGAQFLEPSAGGTGGTGATDPNGHGTHVAGIIAAVADNRVGVAGMAPGTRIMPVRVLDGHGEGWTSDIARGVIHAANHGATVINLSLGSDQPDVTLDKAVQYAVAKGVVVVAAGGNERLAGNRASYPAAYANVIGVAATTSSSRAAAYSNTGRYIDVAAPGDGIVSTYPTRLIRSGYARMSGTSMATPLVAATVAGLRAARPSLTVAQVQSLLASTATDLGVRGRDDTYGAGLVDANRALCTLRVCPAVLTWSGVSSWTPTAGTPATGVVTARTATGGVLAGAPVRVCYAPAHLGRTTCSDRRSDAAGRVATTFTARSITGVSVTYLGTSAATASTTHVSYQTRSAVTTRTGPRSLAVSVAPRQATVLLDRYDAYRRTWTQVRSATTSVAGAAAFTRLPAGTYRIRTPRSSTLAAIVTGAVSVR